MRYLSIYLVAMAFVTGVCCGCQRQEGSTEKNNQSTKPTKPSESTTRTTTQASRTIAPPGPFASAQETITWLSDQAVQSAHEVDGTVLDYSLNSIEKVEKVLGKIHDESKKHGSNEGLTGLSMAYGAYIGECIRKADTTVSWDRDHSDLGERTYPLHWRGGDAFPINWCYGRLTNGEEDDVWIKFRLLSQQIKQEDKSSIK